MLKNVVRLRRGGSFAAGVGSLLKRNTLCRARRLGAPLHRISPWDVGNFAAPAASFFPIDGKETKGSLGDAAKANCGGAAALFAYDGFPQTPVYGGSLLCLVLPFRRGKSEWPV